MLALNPSNRCTATDALQMEYFKKQPGPSAPNELPLPKSKRDAIKERSEQIKRKLSDNNDPTSKISLSVLIHKFIYKKKFFYFPSSNIKKEIEFLRIQKFFIKTN
jgi:hypothetical protein